MLVSSRDLPVERDSVPLHLLGKEPLPKTSALAHLLMSQPDLWTLYGGWVVSRYLALVEEIRDMARRQKLPVTGDLKRVLDVFGADEFVRQGVLDQLVNEIGIDRLLARLTPEQRRELQRRLQETTPPER